MNNTNGNEISEEEMKDIMPKEKKKERERGRAKEEMANEDIETLEYVKPREKGLRALLPEEKPITERAKKAFQEYAPKAVGTTQKVVRKYAPRVKETVKKAFGAVQTYSQQRRERMPQEARTPILKNLIQGYRPRGSTGMGGIGTQGLKSGIGLGVGSIGTRGIGTQRTGGTSTLGDQVRIFGQGLKTRKRA